ncbi:MAG TPA: TonB-dependent receptor [Vicinamibacterales bacterium]|nr:TonB-dependent receptor [Vicinamibacterales bacterium]
MSSSSRLIASAVIGALGLLCTSMSAAAQTATLQPEGHIASLAPGSIRGTVQDEKGTPVSGAMVSALGASTAFTISDRSGHFELRTLSPGPYLVRAHLSGFTASRGQIVDVHPSSRASSSIAMHHVASDRPVLAAGMGSSVGSAQPIDVDEAVPTGTSGSHPSDDHGEVAWRLRHARRGILKDAVVPDAVLADDEPDTGTFGQNNLFAAPARMASNFFSGTPFSGQFNLLTTGAFDSPQQLFTTDGFARSVAYVSVGAPVGSEADWTVHGALTQGDISSWIVAGSYATRAVARHQYDLGLSYSTQRYNAGNPAAFHDVGDTSRNAGAVYGFDTFRLTPALAVTYGTRYAHYDYLDGRSLLSPKVGLTISPDPHLRFSGLVSRREVAPGAEEFLPPSDGGIWLPPQRTFSSLSSDEPLQAERTTHAQVQMERDIAGATIVLRAFRQHVDNQLVTAFGVNVPGHPPTSLGHYFVGNDGVVDADGWTAGIRGGFAGHVHGSIEYTETRAEWTPTSDLSYLILLAPAASRLESDRIHDIAATVETDVPETSTKVFVMYRVSNAFAHPASASPDHSLFDARFDVQIRQSLPFMDFSSARWEMLIAVRNFLREAAPDQSVYDELLVVRPPKRIVGGLTLHF